MSDLKNCPFCGEKPDTEIIYLSSAFPRLGEFDPRKPIVNIGCSHCGIAISYRPDFWNTRPAEDALNRELTEQAANYENIICEYKRDVKQAVEQIDTLTAEVERLKEALEKIYHIGFGNAPDKVKIEFIKTAVHGAVHKNANAPDTNVGKMEE